MSVLATPSLGSLFSPQRLLTIADVAALPADLPSGPVRYELDDGRLVVMPPPGDIHGHAQLGFGSELRIQGEKRGHGEARGEVGIILRRNPDRLIGPDAVFICKKSLPVRLSKEGYLETIPDLVLEIRSKNESWAAVQRKVKEYLQASVKVVWVADSEKLTVTEFRQRRTPRVFHADDTLAIEDLIPGFALKVRDGFR